MSARGTRLLLLGGVAMFQPVNGYQIRRELAGGPLGQDPTSSRARSFLSGILLPMTLGPGWLLAASDFMPFRWTVDAVRDSFVGDVATSAMAWGTGLAAAMFALALWWGTATVRKENA